jgi:hypothetical protein
MDLTLNSETHGRNARSTHLGGSMRNARPKRRHSPTSSTHVDDHRFIVNDKVKLKLKEGSGRCAGKGTVVNVG